MWQHNVNLNLTIQINFSPAPQRILSFLRRFFFRDVLYVFIYVLGDVTACCYALKQRYV